MDEDFEMFPPDQVQLLREELVEHGSDCFRAAELLFLFLSQRGYGVSHLDARSAACRMESLRFSTPCMQQELEKIAYSM